MKKSTLTTAEIRRYNKSQIYKTIYNNKEISKQGIGQLLQLSLPTVTQNLTELQQERLIKICRSFKRLYSAGRIGSLRNLSRKKTAHDFF